MKFKLTTKGTFEKMVRSIFQIHLVMLLALTSLNYIDPLGPMHGEPVTFTLRGNLNIVPIHGKWLLPRAQFVLNDSIGISAIVGSNAPSFIRLDYTDLGKAFTGMNLLVLITELAYLWIYLYVSWCFWQLTKDLRTTNIFSTKNIIRMRKLALVFPIGSLLYNIHGWLFTDLVNQMITYPGHRIFFPQQRTLLNLLFNNNMFYALGVMTVILILIQVFVQGNRLQEENALTI